MSWLKQLFFRWHLYQDLSEEIREHLDEKIEELVASGMSRKEAAAIARREIAGLVLRESLEVTLAGLAVGTFGAFAMARLFPTEGVGWSGSGIFLYGVSRTDSLTYISAAALLTSVVLAASWVPARRAMGVDPMVALRYE